MMLSKEGLIARLREFYLLQQVYSVSVEEKTEVYLAGGCLRDMLLTGSAADFDFAVEKGMQELAESVAEQVEGSCFPLGSEGNYRVAVKGPEGLMELDFSPYKDREIEDDLKKRDFTINALAISVKELFEDDSPLILDPSGGLEDLAGRKLRLISHAAIDDDPLRILRGFRIGASYSLELDPDFVEAAGRNKNLLGRVSAERIRTELFKLLACKGAGPYVGKMAEIKVLEEIIPEITGWESIDQGSHHRFYLLKHSLKTLEYLEQILSDGCDTIGQFWPEFISHLNEEVEYAVTRRGLLKFAALLHDSGKPACIGRVEDKITFYGHEEEGALINGSIAKRLKMGNNSRNILEVITRQHMRTLHLSKVDTVSRRAADRFIRDCGRETPEVLLLALADAWATRDERDVEYADVEKVVSLLARRYFESPPEAILPLLNGREVMGLLGIDEGVEVGRYIHLLIEEQGEGRVKSKGDAVKFLEALRDIYG